jgi:hypothetical protein
MNILDRLNSIFKVYCFKDGATKESIKKLIEFSPIEIPQDYLDLISKQQEIEMQVAGEYYLRLWDVDRCIDLNQAYNIQEDIPTSLAIGSDGGGSVLIYMNIDNNFGLYLAPLACLYEPADDCEYIAPSLERFLVFAEGIDAYLRD